VGASQLQLRPVRLLLLLLRVRKHDQGGKGAPQPRTEAWPTLWGPRVRPQEPLLCLGLLGRRCRAAQRVGTLLLTCLREVCRRRRLLGGINAIFRLRRLHRLRCHSRHSRRRH